VAETRVRRAINVTQTVLGAAAVGFILLGAQSTRADSVGERVAAALPTTAERISRPQQPTVSQQPKKNQGRPNNQILLSKYIGVWQSRAASWHLYYHKGDYPRKHCTAVGDNETDITFEADSHHEIRAKVVYRIVLSDPCAFETQDKPLGLHLDDVDEPKWIHDGKTEIEVILPISFKSASDDEVVLNFSECSPDHEILLRSKGDQLEWANYRECHLSQVTGPISMSFSKKKNQ
jgi:hypothetical protein